MKIWKASHFCQALWFSISCDDCWLAFYLLNSSLALHVWLLVHIQQLFYSSQEIRDWNHSREMHICVREPNACNKFVQIWALKRHPFVQTTWITVEIIYNLHIRYNNIKLLACRMKCPVSSFWSDSMHDLRNRFIHSLNSLAKNFTFTFIIFVMWQRATSNRQKTPHTFEISIPERTL